MAEAVKREGKHLDRSKWYSGEWDSEPDELGWADPTTGLRCRILRHPHFGHLCGYVGVPKGHPLYGWNCANVSAHLDFEHNLTFDGHMREMPYEWWLGFDFAHAGGVVPSMDPEWVREIRDAYAIDGMECTYKNIAHAKQECERLAIALAGKADHAHQP